MGIEPTSEAWEASILPLYDARFVPPDSIPFVVSEQLRCHNYNILVPSTFWETLQRQFTIGSAIRLRRAQRSR